MSYSQQKEVYDACTINCGSALKQENFKLANNFGTLALIGALTGTLAGGLLSMSLTCLLHIPIVDKPTGDLFFYLGVTSLVGATGGLYATYEILQEVGVFKSNDCIGECLKACAE